MRCSSCTKQKADLATKKSRLIPGMTLYMCADCLKNKFEPRYVIILAGRVPGGPSKEVIDFIVNKRYIGEEILGKEVLMRR